MVRQFLVLLWMMVSLAAPARAASAPLAAGEHQLVINGVRLWYRVAGASQGTPVVFLHGGPGQGSQTFARFAGPALERRNRMIYLDQRGSGRSEKHWKKEYSLPLMVDDLEQLRRAWGVERMALVGHSFGTVLALEYAAKYPRRVSHLVLTGAVVDFPAAMDVQCARLAKVDPANYAKAVAALEPGSSRRCNVFAAPRKIIDDAMYPDPAVMKLVDDTDSSDGMFNDGQVGGALFNQGLLQYRFTQSARLTMPVLVIAGGADYQAVVDPVRPFVARLGRGRLIEYPGRGHFMFVEDPERFARDVTRFLKER
jgi:proline iminopeptidase